ncbi:MAG: hypothetical protein CVV27_09700 [Candidatus Melainabacteria bacterium HGW-Melainabacteria-1]|nr:MAG: hypothetical protein CVV27_09700 [Candidatus Melainabacteria bacterium HGW-Melainabacteria-1]
MLRFLTLGLLLFGLSAASPANWSWQAIDTGLEAAAKADRLLLLQVYAEWCHECHKLEADMRSNPTLARLLQEHFVPARLDIQSHRQVLYQGEALSEEQLSRKLRIPGPPVLMILSPDGKQLGRLIGYRPPDQVTGFLAQLRNKYVQSKP